MYIGDGKIIPVVKQVDAYGNRYDKDGNEVTAGQ